MYISHVAACFRLVSPLKIQQHQDQEKGCLMFIADPSNLGRGKNTINEKEIINIVLLTFFPRDL